MTFMANDLVATTLVKARSFSHDVTIPTRAAMSPQRRYPEMPAVQETIERVSLIRYSTSYKYGLVTDIESDKAPKGLSRIPFASSRRRNEPG